MSDHPIPVVDVFAGPGGLGEGFASSGYGNFCIRVSAEMDAGAHQTLVFRGYFRAMKDPDDRARYYYPLASRIGRDFDDSLVPDAAAARAAVNDARREALQLQLGKAADDEVLRERVAEIARSSDQWVLVGGPPCQAYSLAGRARNRGNKGYIFENDERSHLYQHYLRLIEDFGPAVFVMENVKGLLSARLNGGSMFQRIVDDLHGIRQSGLGYKLFSLNRGPADDSTDPTDFLVHAELHGVPQARHRVIILGVREDVLRRREPGRLAERNRVPIRAAHTGLPPLRSEVSRNPERRSVEGWADTVERQYRFAASACDASPGLDDIAVALRKLRSPALEAGWQTSSVDWAIPALELMDRACSNGLTRQMAHWLIDPHMSFVRNHAARAHMAPDLGRYAFAAVFREIRGRSPKSADFPAGLAPDHSNWKSGSFADRFFVQPPNGQSSTVTSHIAKDGHHFIHWDPLQCRAFTVREAARVQTFPDSYVFLGNRTQQFHQVGNAVPPFLATQISRIVAELLE